MQFLSKLTTSFFVRTLPSKNKLADEKTPGVKEGNLKKRRAFLEHPEKRLSLLVLSEL